MRNLQIQLDTWLDAGVITPDVADRIRAHEADEGRPPAVRLAAEALGYVGTALAGAAVWLLVFELWQELATLTQTATLAVVAALLSAGAIAVGGRDSAPLDRLQGVLAGAALSVGAMAGWLFADEVLRLSDAVVATSVGAGVTVGACVTLRKVPRFAVQLTGLAGAVTLVVGAADLTGSSDSAGVLGVWLLAVAVVAVAPRGWVGPARSAELSASLLALGTAQLLVWHWTGAAGSVLGTATAVAFVATGLRRGRGSGVGAAGLLVFAPQLTYTLFGDRLAGPALLGVIGLVLVLVAVGLTRVRAAASPKADA